MDPIVTSAFIFFGAALVGMFAHYINSWAKGEISGNLLDYLFRDNPRNTVISLSGVVTAAATAYFTGTLNGLDLQLLLLAGFTGGFTIDSTLNKGGVAALSPAASAVAAILQPQSKQGGFARAGLLCILVVASVLAACATLGGTSTLDKNLLEAQSVATTALSTSTTLLVNHTITLAQDQDVRKTHDIVITAINAARGLEGGGDTVGAQSLFDGVQADITALQTFISTH